MVISRTPYRISFLGGGTDYPAWYRQHGGAVLSATIDKYCYITCRFLPPFFEHRIRVVYSHIENCQSIDEIKHPAVREVLRFLNVTRGVELHHDGDLPARSGMGTSSSFTVGSLHAVHALLGQMVGKEQLAREGIHVEQDLLREKVGSQDQVIAAYGGFNHLRFMQSGELGVRPLTLKRERIEELQDHLMLFFTGLQRERRPSSPATAETETDAQRRQLWIIGDLVNEAVALLASNEDINGFGDLLHEAWTAERSLNGSDFNPATDDLYAEARQAGARGGKIMGAGGTGFILLFVDPKQREAIRRQLSRLIYVPFEFENSGSQIVYFDPQGDYAAEDRARMNLPSPIFREMRSLAKPGSETTA